MPKWVPERCWDHQDALIIGGGPSLQTLDWSLLKKENTIGCNTAFIHGPEICKICIFGDYRWWVKFEEPLLKYAESGGTVFTNCPKLFNTRLKWLWVTGRKMRGLHDRSLGWNGHTGASAINLAILLGAARIFLLGYDMKHIDGRSNWHDRILDKHLVRPSVYSTFCRQFEWVKKDWKAKFPDVEIWNVTSGSGLSNEIIPWLSPDEFWADRGMIRMGFERAV
jgi:hypothetical protein